MSIPVSRCLSLHRSLCSCLSVSTSLHLCLRLPLRSSTPTSGRLRNRTESTALELFARSCSQQHYSQPPKGGSDPCPRTDEWTDVVVRHAARPRKWGRSRHVRPGRTSGTLGEISRSREARYCTIHLSAAVGRQTRRDRKRNAGCGGLWGAVGRQSLMGTVSAWGDAKVVGRR